MGWMIFGWISGVIFVFLAVILLRGAVFRPKGQVRVSEEKIEVDQDRIIENLRQLVRCKTVSYRDPAREDDGEFEKLIDLLPVLYPTVWETCTLSRFEGRGLLFRWKGKAEGAPTVLMAHYDVVPVSEENWEKPPFDGVLEDGVLWGRGTLDTKVTFGGVLEGAEQLMRKEFIPEHDVYFAFSGGEEVAGEGAVRIVEYFEKNQIRPAMVVDEGGAVVEGVFPGVSVPCGLIGIAEKGMMNVEYRTCSQGGHASAPKPHSPVVELADTCLKIEKHPFRSHLTPPAAKMFDTLGRHSSFLYRVIFANLWCFGGVLNLLCKKQGGELNALMRTTVAFTQMEGSTAANVIPPEAILVSNIRLNPADTVEGALAYLEKTVNNDRVQIRMIDGTNPSPISRTDCKEWDKVALAVASTWRGAIVSPYLMVQCSDSRHWGRICDRVYRFSAMDLTGEERATIHGNNERIRVDCACRAVEFYIRLVKQC